MDISSKDKEKILKKMKPPLVRSEAQVLPIDEPRSEKQPNSSVEGEKDVESLKPITASRCTVS